MFDHFRVIGHYRRSIGAIVALGALFGYVNEARRPSSFSATTTVRFIVPEVATSGTSARDSAALLSSSYAKAASTPSFADRVRAALPGDLTVTSVQHLLRVTAADVPGFLDVTAQATTARGAADLADAGATELVTFIRSEQDRTVGTALGPLNQQLADLDVGLRAAGLGEGERNLLIDQRGQLTRLIAESELRLRPALLSPDAAALPSGPTGPSPGRSALTMALLALVLATEGFVLFRYVRGSLPLGDPAGEIGRIVGAPVLELGPVRHRPSSAGVVPFVLEHLSAEVVITVVQCNGVPTTMPASIVADALARSGPRVLLVDVDTRSPRLHEELDLPRSPGLAEVMAGDERLTDVVRASPSGSGVVVLSAGAVGESVGLVTGDLDTLVRQAGADANVLVTSSSTPLDDALLVVHQFPDAVVLVVDARSLRRSDLVETTRVVRSIGGNVVSALCVHTATPTWREQLQHLRRSDV